MGTSRTVEELVRKTEAAARGLERTGKIAVRAAAVATTSIIRDEVRSIAPSGVLSGVGAHGARVGVLFTTAEVGGVASAIVKATGPMQLIERDTKAHREPRDPNQLTPKGRKSRRKVSGKSLGPLVGGKNPGGFAAFVNHPMTHGQHPFWRGARRAEAISMAAFASTVRSELIKAFS